MQWWRHQMETCSALLTLCAGNSAITGQRHCVRLDPRISYAIPWWMETLSRDTESLQWRHNGRDDVPNHPLHDCLVNRLFKAQIKENIKAPHHWPQRPVTRSFDVFFDLRLNKRLSKQSRGWWFETLLRPLWRHCNVIKGFLKIS